jgi:DNA-binding transcriptional LysR family regulator
MDRFTELEAFTSVIDQGGFTGAARKLGVSKSAISKHVAALETRLGVQLLERTTRRVNPTELGLLYYERAIGILDAAHDADRSIVDLSGPASGMLRLGVPAELNSSVLNELVAQFLALHPRLTLEIVPTGGMADVLADDIDLAFRLGAQPDATFQRHHVANVPMHLVAAPVYLDDHSAPARIDDLFGHDLLYLASGTTSPGWQLKSAVGELRSVRGRGRLVSPSSHLLRHAVLAGLGIAFLPEYACGDDVRAGRLVPVLAQCPQEQELYLLQAPGRRTSPKVQAFISFTVQQGRGFSGQPTASRRVAQGLS